jgi:hypothetical protein
MPSLRSITVPPARPKVDPLTHKEVWGFMLQSLIDVETLSGKKPVIARMSFQEHPKNIGDFNEFFELELGGVLTKINLRFIRDFGLYLEVIDCDHQDHPERVLDERLTDCASYHNFLRSRLVESICRRYPV